ncbi:hypothetical protein V8E55_011979, partial [Tylopilus felleus]
DRMDPFAEGRHCTPTVEQMDPSYSLAWPKFNPLLAPPFDTHDYLRRNMLFHTNNCYWTTEPQRSWVKGRNAPATFPRLTYIRIISRAFPWMIHARADNPELGVKYIDHTYSSLRTSCREFCYTALSFTRNNVSRTLAFYHCDCVYHGHNTAGR